MFVKLTLVERRKDYLFDLAVRSGGVYLGAYTRRTAKALEVKSYLLSRLGNGYALPFIKRGYAKLLKSTLCPLAQGGRSIFLTAKRSNYLAEDIRVSYGASADGNTVRARRAQHLNSARAVDYISVSNNGNM